MVTGMGAVTLREVPLRRFHTLGLGAMIGALGAFVLVAPLALSLVVGWIIVADGVLFVLIGLRRALPGGYVRLAADGVNAREWKWRREVFVAWSRVADIGVGEVGVGPDGYHYPDLELVDGQHAPLYMLAGALVPTRLLETVVLRRRPYDQHFDAKLEALRGAHEAYRAGTSDSDPPRTEDDCAPPG
jgi:hypothetical protein